MAAPNKWTVVTAVLLTMNNLNSISWKYLEKNMIFFHLIINQTIYLTALKTVTINDKNAKALNPLPWAAASWHLAGSEFSPWLPLIKKKVFTGAFFYWFHIYSCAGIAENINGHMNLIIYPNWHFLEQFNLFYSKTCKQLAETCSVQFKM